MKTLRLGRLALSAAVALVLAAPALAVDPFFTPNNATAVSSTNTKVDCTSAVATIDIKNTGTKDLYAMPGGTATSSAGLPVRVCQGVRLNFSGMANQGPTFVGLITAGSDTTTADVLCSYPQLNISRTETVTYYPIPGCTSTNALTVSGVLTDSGGLQGNFTTFALTSAAAAANVVKIGVPSGGWVNGLLHFVYEVSDGTDFQAFGGVIPFNAVNKAGTVTCTVGVVTTATQAALAASAGTLTNAITCADGTANTVVLKATDTTSLTATTNRIRYNVEILAATSPVTVTAQ